MVSVFYWAHCRRARLWTYLQVNKPVSGHTNVIYLLKRHFWHIFMDSQYEADLPNVWKPSALKYHHHTSSFWLWQCFLLKNIHSSDFQEQRGTSTVMWRCSIPYSQSLQSRLGFELILIFCSKFFVMKLVRSPSWLTVPSSSRAEEIVARRPSDWPPLPPPRLPAPPVEGMETFSIFFSYNNNNNNKKLCLEKDVIVMGD